MHTLLYSTSMCGPKKAELQPESGQDNNQQQSWLTCSNLCSALWASALMLQGLLQALSAEIMTCMQSRQRLFPSDCIWLCH